MPVPERRPPLELTLFVSRLLHGLDPQALVESFEEAPRRGYLLRVQVGGEVGKPLRLPTRLVQRAAQEPWAEQMLRSILRRPPPVPPLGEHDLLQSRLVLHRGPGDDICPACGRAVPREGPPFFREGRLVHVRCFAGGSPPTLAR